MAIITVPTALKVRSMNWTLHRPAQINRSGYTGRRQVVANPWHGRWTASVELAPLQQGDAQALRGFIAALKGQINTFRLEAVASLQSSSVVTLNANAAAGATSISVTGWTDAAVGMLFTLNDQLNIVKSVSGGTIGFEPPLRAAATSGTSVSVQRPTALVALAASESSWSFDINHLHYFAFDVEEAF